MKQRNYKNTSNLCNVKNDVRLNGNVYLGEYEERRIQAFLDANNIAIIGRNAFSGVEASELTLPKSVRTIEQNSFLNNNIQNLIIVSSDINIERLAFRNCKIEKLVLDIEKLKQIFKVMDETDYLKYIGLIGGKTKIMKYENYLEERKHEEESCR